MTNTNTTPRTTTPAELHATISFLMDEQERLTAEGKHKEFWEIEPVLDTLQRRYYSMTHPEI
jgi:hypothetical protein